MKKFVFRSFLFLIVLVILGECIVRCFSLTIDVPKMYVDRNNLIRCYPNQSGNYLGGKHKWKINRFGFPGYEPKSLHSVITVIGDSFISNMMNPPECHQAKYLAELMHQNDFFPASRDGGSFLEFMEYASELDTLNPVYQVIYVHDKDFIESIKGSNTDFEKTQIDIENKIIYYARLSSSKWKESLYNFKFLYYLYRNIIIPNKNKEKGNQSQKVKEIDYAKIENFITYIKNNYNTSNLILVFHPESNIRMMNMTKSAGFNILLLKVEDPKSWQLEHDSHWSCFGHLEVATQVAAYLKFFVASKKLRSS
jgi:hypothetical protein